MPDVLLLIPISENTKHSLKNYKLLEDLACLGKILNTLMIVLYATLVGSYYPHSHSRFPQSQPEGGAVPGGSQPLGNEGEDDDLYS